MEDENRYPVDTSSNLVNLINMIIREKKRQEAGEPLIINGKIMHKLKPGQVYGHDGRIITL